MTEEFEMNQPNWNEDEFDLYALAATEELYRVPNMEPKSRRLYRSGGAAIARYGYFFRVWFRLFLLVEASL